MIDNVGVLLSCDECEEGKEKKDVRAADNGTRRGW